MLGVRAFHLAGRHLGCVRELRGLPVRRHQSEGRSASGRSSPAAAHEMPRVRQTVPVSPRPGRRSGLGRRNLTPSRAERSSAADRVSGTAGKTAPLTTPPGTAPSRPCSTKINRRQLDTGLLIGVLGAVALYYTSLQPGAAVVKAFVRAGPAGDPADGLRPDRAHRDRAARTNRCGRCANGTPGHLYAGCREQ